MMTSGCDGWRGSIFAGAGEGGSSRFARRRWVGRVSQGPVRGGLAVSPDVDELGGDGWRWVVGGGGRFEIGDGDIKIKLLLL